MTSDSENSIQLDPDGGMRGYLSGLPVADSSAALWPRIERTRLRRRRRRLLAGSGVLGALVLLAVLMVRVPVPADAPALTREAAPVIEIAAELRDIDRSLQAAYDRDASPEQIDALWQAREFAATQINQESYHHDAIIRL
ncbi:MAG: hypothetical protein SGI99_09355 [Pseudomonadota bacterium]|nr:hypothetical protein [Pseudomonadota bacterium]